MERRVNRATTSVFRFDNGLTIGSLTHTILLHEMVSRFYFPYGEIPPPEHRGGFGSVAASLVEQKNMICRLRTMKRYKQNPRNLAARLTWYEGKQVYLLSSQDESMQKIWVSSNPVQIFHTALEVVCDGLHVLIEDPYGPRIGVQYRLPQSNDYHKVHNPLKNCYRVHLQNSTPFSLELLGSKALSWHSSFWQTNSRALNMLKLSLQIGCMRGKLLAGWIEFRPWYVRGSIQGLSSCCSDGRQFQY